MRNKSLRDKIDKEYERLIKEIDSLEAAKILPLTYTRAEKSITKTAKGLKSELENLLAGDLTVAVCGLVKAGKSSFLDSILFGEEVLPTFPTPMTAKLTFITHTDGPEKCEIKFYSKEQYAEMSDRLSDDARASLKKREEKSIEAGVCPAMLWDTKIECSGDDRFESLKDYVTQDGKYTPFVEYVTLRICRPELKGLQIVDTPGLDDPNPLNSEVTSLWAAKAHAVIYITPWKGLEETDRQFIEENFGSLRDSSNNRVFVISKIDQNADWVVTLAEFKKSYPRERDSVCGYSSYVDLLRKRVARGEMLSEDEYETLDAKTDINVDPGNVKELIQNKLLLGDMAIRIEKCRNLIEGCYLEALDQAKALTAEFSSKVQTYKNSKEEVERQANQLKVCEKEFEKAANRALTRAENDILFGIGDLRGRLDVVRKSLERCVDTAFKDCDRDSLILPCVRNALSACNSEMNRRIEDIIGGYVNSVKMRFGDLKQELSSAIVKSNCDGIVEEPSLCGIYDLVNGFMQKIDVKIGIDGFSQAISFWSKASTNVATVKSIINQTFDEFIKKIPINIDVFTKDARKELGSYVVKAKTGVGNLISERLLSAKIDPAAKEQLLLAAESDYRQAQSDLKRVETLFVEFKSHI